jgi:protein tyrosine phosphatase (PTP) superfamily phosphohydrolase (DUF442 family)
MKKLVGTFLLIAIACSGWLYYTFTNHVKSVYTVIPDQVYRSAQLNRTSVKSAIIDKGIRSIINLRGGNTSKQWYRDEVEVSETLGVVHHDLSFRPQGLPVRRSVRELARLLQITQKPVLVHCKNGADRAGLASAIALLQQEQSSMDESAEHVSIKFMAFDPDSTGKLFYQQYSDWLREKGFSHSVEQFARWLEQDYIDDRGNFLYYIDAINNTTWKNGTQYEDGYSFKLVRHKDNALALGGWVFDEQKTAPVEKVELFLDNEIAGVARYGLPRADVAAAFQLSDLSEIGWHYSKPLEEIGDGCYQLSLAFIGQNGRRWHSPPQARICIE